MRLIIAISGYYFVMLNKNANISEVVKALSGAVICDRDYVDGKYIFTPKEDNVIEAILIQDIPESIHVAHTVEVSGV